MDEAILRATRHLEAQGAGAHHGGVAFLRSLSQRKPYGWVLSYDTRQYVETGEPGACMVGQGPIVVLDGGEIHELPGNVPSRVAIREFEAMLGLA